MSNTPIIVKFIDGKEVTLSEEEAKKDIAKNEKLIALNGQEFEYQRDRLAEYPDLQECIHAILDDDLTALQAKRKLVKEKYPKPE